MEKSCWSEKWCPVKTNHSTSSNPKKHLSICFDYTMIILACTSVIHINFSHNIINYCYIRYCLYLSHNYLKFAVSDKFGSSSPQTEVFILAPTTSRPVLMERYSGKLPAQLLKAILAIFVRIVYLHAIILGMCSLFQVYHITKKYHKCYTKKSILWQCLTEKADAFIAVLDYLLHQWVHC